MKKIILRAKIGVGILVFGILGLAVWPVQTASKEIDVSMLNLAVANEVAYGQPITTLAQMPRQAITPNPAVQAMMDQVTTSTLRSMVGDLSGEWPVMIDTLPYTITSRNTANTQAVNAATKFAYQTFNNTGLNTAYADWQGTSFWGTFSSRNVLAQITGTLNPQKIYMITAHLDDMPPDSLAPGADDNASGSVAVLLAAKLMARYSWTCTLRFALWTGEEQGLLGSKAYAEATRAANQDIRGVINLDMVGWNASPQNKLALVASSQLTGSLNTAQIYSDVVASYGLNLSPEVHVYTTGGAFSDHYSFWQQNYSAIMLTDVGSYPYYHTSNDRMRYLDFDFYANVVKASIGALAHECGFAPNKVYLPQISK